MSERWPSQPTKVDESEDGKVEDVVLDEELPAAEEIEAAEAPQLRAPDEQQHAYGDLDIPDDVNLIEGEPDGTRRGVAVVAARFNGEIVNKLLESALEVRRRTSTSSRRKLRAASSWLHWRRAFRSRSVS